MVKPPTRPALRYHGGKWKIAPWIIAQMPRHSTYVEPFGGAASVLLRKPPVEAEIYNDLDGEVVNLFRVLRDPPTAAELRRLLELTPFARAEFRWSYEPGVDALETAYKTIIRSYMGFSTDSVTRKTQTGFRANRARNKNNAGWGKHPAHEWATFADVIPDFVARLRTVVIEERDALEVIGTYDSPETLFFVDPPYMKATRGDNRHRHGYRYEMNDSQHRSLLFVLRQLQGKVIVSGYWSRLYADELSGWRTLQKAAYANCAHARTEHLWMNFPATAEPAPAVIQRPSRSTQPAFAQGEFTL